MRFADVDLNEDEDMAPPEEEDEDEEEGDPGEFIDLLDVLDGKGEIDMGSDDDKRPKHPRQKDSEDEASEDEEQEGEEEESEEEEHNDPLSASDDDEAPEASEEFQKFISTLDPTTKKRKADEAESTDGPAKDTRSRKRRLIAERTEAGAEDEFRAHASGLSPLSLSSPIRR